MWSRVKIARRFRRNIAADTIRKPIDGDDGGEDRVKQDVHRIYDACVPSRFDHECVERVGE